MKYVDSVKGIICRLKKQNAGMLWTPLSMVTLDTGTTGSSQEKKRQRAAIKKGIMCFFIIIGITEAN